MLAPRPVRRLLVAPVVPLVTLFAISALPLTAIVAAGVSPWLPGRWRPLRVLWVAIVMLVVESLALVSLLLLWFASGFGRRSRTARWQDAHYRLMRVYLIVVVATARRTFNLTFDVDAEAARVVDLDVDEALTASLAEAAAPSSGHLSGGHAATEADRRVPLIVLSRHAGPGDSLLLVHALLAQGFRPRIVLRSSLQWVPALDIVLNRLPNRFVTGGSESGGGSRGGATSAAIGELAAGMTAGDALVLFPEGRNFTPHRRTTSIARLEELGRHEDAERAREMRHVLVPRLGGTSAAVSAAPSADVIFVAHTGLEDLSSFIDLYRGVPMDASIRVKLWRVAADEVPRTQEAAAIWIDGWWRRIDAWILEHYGRDALPDAAASGPPDEERRVPGPTS
jgi:1-acyl-sn-glycerol-3-phosphate acyltransferase